MFVIFLRHRSSSSVHIKLHWAVFQRVALRQGLFIIFFFPSSTWRRLSAWRRSCNTSRRVRVFFFVCPSFFALRVCLSLLVCVFHLFLNRSDGPSAEKSGQGHTNASSLSSSSSLGSQLVKHHCTSFFFFSTSGTTLLLCTSVKIHKSVVVVVYIESDFCQRFQQNNSRFT